MAKFASGGVASITVGWFSLANETKVELLGTVQHAVAQIKKQNKMLTAMQMLLTNSSNYYKPHLREIEYFVHSLINELQPSPSAEDALKDLEAISLAYKNRICLD